MCKLFAVSNTERMSKTLLYDTIAFVSKLYGESQRDGLGFSVQSNKQRYTERYANPKNYCGVGRLKEALNTVDSFFTEKLKGEFESPEWKLTEGTGPLIIHGRTSTSEVNLMNTHPFTKNAWTLAHNGVVAWDGEARKMETTCDSEHLLNCYAMGKGTDDLKYLSGWAAWVAINPSGLLVAGRDEITPLHLSYSKKYETYFIATQKSDLEDYMKKIGLKNQAAIMIRANSETTFLRDGNKVTGKTHGGLARRVSQYMYGQANLALGTHAGATTNQVLGCDRSKYESHWNSASHDDMASELQESVSQWEKMNLHNYEQ